ncbi:MAG: ABC transporter ATP-binding protein [Armatimonadota bacterium]
MIELQNITVKNGRFVLSGISCEIPDGRYGVLMGKTGAGKTTLLEVVCGLLPVAAGQVVLDGEDVTNVPPAERGIGYVSQRSLLLPSMDVRHNLAFPLWVRKWTPEAMGERVAELAKLLDIKPLLDREPRDLSGGERQRVALGKALAPYPRVLCLDEPMSAVDEKAREGLYELLTVIKTELPASVLHVTHNQQEAERLADVCLLLEDGRIKIL